MAQEIIVKNNAYSTLLAGITNVATNLSVQSGHGARFSAPGAGQIAKITLYDAAGNKEIVHCSARTTDSFTIARGQEGTTARAWNAGDGFEERATSGFLAVLSQLDRTETHTAVKTFAGGIAGDTAFSGSPQIAGGVSVTGEPKFTAGIGSTYTQNIGLTAAVATKALTVALKTKALADPSAGSPVDIAFRNITVTTGNYVTRSIVAAASIVVPSGATLGFTAAEAGSIYVYACDNGTIREVGVSKKLMLDEAALHATTAVSATADSATVLYTTTAMATAAVRLIGRIDITTGAVAGEWDNAATLVYVGNAVSYDHQPPYAPTLYTQEITTTGTFTVPAAQVFAALVGGGGGASIIVVTGAAGGGGASADMASLELPPYAEGTVLTVNIGAAGVGRTGSTGNGTQGGDTTLVTSEGEIIAKAPGGLPGTQTGINPGLGGLSGTVGAQIPSGFPGLAGEDGETDGNDFGGDGADSIYRKIKIGAAYLGGLGSTVNNGAGQTPAAGVYGAGGGAGTGAGAGANGTAGVVYFWWWK